MADIAALAITCDKMYPPGQPRRACSRHIDTMRSSDDKVRLNQRAGAKTAIHIQPPDSIPVLLLGLIQHHPPRRRSGDDGDYQQNEGPKNHPIAAGFGPPVAQSSNSTV